MAKKYETVNGQWPDSIPPLTAKEAERAGRKLMRFALGRKKFRERFRFGLKVEITSGRNYSYLRYGVLRVNPERGWHDLVHGISHSAHHILHPRAAPHDTLGRHAFLEKNMIAHVVKSGWLEGKLKKAGDVKPKIDVKDKRYQTVIASLKKWEGKLKRAKNAIKKLEGKKKYYERTINP